MGRLSEIRHYLKKKKATSKSDEMEYTHLSENSLWDLKQMLRKVRNARLG